MKWTLPISFSRLASRAASRKGKTARQPDRYGHLRNGASTQIESVGRCNATREWTKRREKDQALGNAQERAAQLQAKRKELADARQLLDELRGVEAGQQQAVETARANASEAESRRQRLEGTVAANKRAMKNTDVLLPRLPTTPGESTLTCIPSALGEIKPGTIAGTWYGFGPSM